MGAVTLWHSVAPFFILVHGDATEIGIAAVWLFASPVAVC